MKIALVYDRVNKYGGAERVLEALHEIWPDAPLYTAVYNPKSTLWANNFKIKTSFLQKFPFAKTNHEIYPNLTPAAFENFDFSDFDIVLSITSAEAKNIITSQATLHICYCLTPTRYLWSHKSHYEKQGLMGFFLKLSGTKLRLIDFLASQRVDHFVAISKTVQKRIKKYYRQNSELIYPPVNLDFPKFEAPQNLLNLKPYYLIVSRLVSYKKVDLSIKAFNKLNKNLVIIGKGKEYSKLKSLAGPTIYFRSDLTDAELSSYYTHCRALIFAQEEDFGIASVEAQAHGKPVIAYAKGAAAETVINSQTGIIFESQTLDSLVTSIEKFEKMKFDSEKCRENAKLFSKEKFKKQMKNFVEKAWQNYQSI